MPELPEIETIKKQLNNRVKGKEIKEVKVNLSKMVRYPLDKFKKLLKGAKIETFDRRAKLLIINLSNNYSLVVHLKLSGQLILNGEIGKHSHVVYYFKDGAYLVHNDLRQFGFIKVVQTDELPSFFEKEGFGPEPLEKDFTLEKFRAKLKKRPRSQIKKLLMDQSFVAGIGNIYGDEILFYAGVRPTRKVESLTSEEIEKTYNNIEKVLKMALEAKGTSANDYFDIDGEEGDFWGKLKVYQREGQVCKKCGSEIERIKLNNRSAHYCPKCQE